MDAIKKVKPVEQDSEPVASIDAPTNPIPTTSPEPTTAEAVSDTIALLTRKGAEEILKRKVTDKDWAKIVGVITSDKEFMRYSKLRVEGFCFNY